MISVFDKTKIETTVNDSGYKSDDFIEVLGGITGESIESAIGETETDISKCQSECIDELDSIKQQIEQRIKDKLEFTPDFVLSLVTEATAEISDSFENLTSYFDDQLKSLI